MIKIGKGAFSETDASLHEENNSPLHLHHDVPKVHLFPFLQQPDALKEEFSGYFNFSFIGWLAEVKVERYGRRRLLVSLIFYSICVYLCMIFTNLADIRRHEMQNKGFRDFHLPDLGHALLPRTSYHALPDHFVTFGFVCTSLYFLVGHRHRLGILRRFFYCHGLLMLIRNILIVITTMPDPNPACQNPEDRPPREIFQTYNVFSSETCGDLMFSGHSVCLTLMALIWTDYGPQHFGLRLAVCELSLRTLLTPFSNIFAGTTAICGMLSLLSARYHYSIDIVVAFVLTRATWNTYDHVLRHRALREQNPIINYLERRTSEGDIQALKGKLTEIGKSLKKSPKMSRP